MIIPPNHQGVSHLRIKNYIRLFKYTKAAPSRELILSYRYTTFQSCAFHEILKVSQISKALFLLTRV